MRRSTVLSLPPQLAFPGQTVKWPKRQRITICILTCVKVHVLLALHDTLIYTRQEPKLDHGPEVYPLDVTNIFEGMTFGQFVAHQR
jgi:hypothetical protein